MSNVMPQASTSVHRQWKCASRMRACASSDSDQLSLPCLRLCHTRHMLITLIYTNIMHSHRPTVYQCVQTHVTSHMLHYLLLVKRDDEVAGRL